MKKSVLILLSLFAINAAAADHEWIAVNSIHPLWDVFDVPVKATSDGSFAVEEKRVGAIVCTKTRLLAGDDNPLLPRQEQTHCTFPRDISDADATAFFKALKVEAMNTNGAYTEVKVFDRLIAVLDDDTGADSRIYLDHACRQVRNRKDATACLEFWAEDILPSFEEPNDTRLVEASPLNLKRATQSLDWIHGAEYAAEGKRALATADYIGLFLEHADEHHLRYYVLRNGQNVVPQEILDANEADIEYTDLGEQVKTVQKEDLDSFIADSLRTLFLGVSPKTFAHFAERVEETLRMIFEDNQ